MKLFVIGFIFLCSSVIAQQRHKGSIPSTKQRASIPINAVNSAHQIKENPRNVREFLTTLEQNNSLTSEDTAYVITSEHVSSLSGVHHIYYRQAINGIEIQGTESSLHIANDGTLAKAHTNFISGVTSQIKSSGASLSASDAIQAIAGQMNYGTVENLTEISSKSSDKSKLFSKGGISGVEIPAKQMYYLVPNDGIRMVWEISIQELNSSDWWNFRVDASTGVIIDKYNFTQSCNIVGDHSEHVHTTTTDENCEEDFSVIETPRTPVANEEDAFVGSYLVYPVSIESPYYGARQLVTNPENLTASPFGWHDTDGVAGSEFTDTRGNNIESHLDLNADNTIDANSQADGGAGLNFNFAFDATTFDAGSGQTIPLYSGANPSFDAAVTNVFYWSNIIHDITYLYGFDEASGNFQENNYGNGGLGNDSVIGDNQDGSGTCNANFGTPPDGNSPRMQMFVCNDADGAYDNLVIVHEYAHGISTRLTGGAGNSGGLNNQEQQGEGWSDYYGYMYTMNTSNATADRAVGTFLIGQGINGSGIRSFPYSTNMATNPQTYQSLINLGDGAGVAPHAVGEIWATMLYDLTQALIAEYGFDSDLYTGTGGNNISLALVTEGLKLQPASPGFIDSRDAILLADQLLYNGDNQCLIWEAFAARGLGFDATQGSSNLRSDGTAGFQVPPISLTVSTTNFCSINGQETLSGGLVGGGTYSGPGVTDDGNGATFTFDPEVAGIGTHTITYTATDCNGMMGTDTDTITVTEVLPELNPCVNTTIPIGANGTALFDPTAPTNITIVGGNNGSNAQGDSVFAITITEDVTLTFDWNYTTTDDPGFDSFGYVIDDLAAYTQLTSDAIGAQSGSSNVSLTAGQIFGFTVRTDDNGFGAATATITNVMPTFSGALDQSNWEELLFTSDGSATFGGRPVSLLNSCGTINTTLSQSVFTCLDIGVNTVTVTVTDANGNTDTCTTDVTITGSALNTTTFSAGSWDNSVPTGTSMAIIDDTYDTAVLGDITACSCQINSTETVTVRAGDFMNIAGNITVNGTLIVEHEGSVVQIDENAQTINNGSISVAKMTPLIDDRNFVAMSSPVSAEARDRVYGNSRAVFSIIPSNFVPYAIDPVAFPEFVDAENFLDDNNDYLAPVTGSTALPAPGIGQLVFPQPAPNVGDGAYTLTYTQDATHPGTLNSGTITVPINYNGPATINNYNILGNPYASAIDVTAFITANDAVSAVYYWDHITNPTSDLPGAGTSNFSMNDISMRNALMGVAAVNGGTAPSQFMASGQGFGIKAEQAEMMNNTPVVFTNTMRVTGNNDGFRNSESEEVDPSEKLWLNLTTSAYDEAISQVGVGFTDQATAAFDPGYDTKRLGTFLSLFTNLEGEYLAIQGREAFHNEMEIPLGFSTTVEEEAIYTINIDRFEGLHLETAPVYLVDHVLNTVTNLKETSYSFTATKGIQPDRFIIVFKEREVLSTDDGIIKENEITLFPNPTSHTVTLGYVGSKQLQKVMISNINGQYVQQMKVTGFNQSQSFDVQKLSTGIYFMQVIFEDQIVVKKLIVN
ncbi:M36 family metallopeptidase [Dokdonia ponticola]|uniref:M36 family metallopeptidase n=1 Tax=Dokdonia ponticola TaxID=2041041 RepID=A0ABV9I0A7_9FLAO